MNYEEIFNRLQSGQIARRMTWDREWFLEKDSENKLILKNDRIPSDPGRVWKRTGYDANADDYYIVCQMS